MDALIGHTGFVGRNLARQRAWGACFNRENIDAIRGRRFERVVCAGLPTNRWLANGNPGGDRSNLMSLAGALAEVDAERFVLVSTTDVYPVPVGVDESTPFEPARSQAYAEHRLEFERMVAGMFEHCHVVRLPAAFGPDMQRGVLSDLVRRRGLEAIDPRSTYQWYPVARLADDIDRAVELDLRLVNLCAAPVTVSQLHGEFFDDLSLGGRTGPLVRHDVRTRHGRLFGGPDGYVMGAEATVASIGEWLRTLGQFDAPA